MRINTPILAAAAALCLITSNVGLAQAPSGTISTNITDPTNALWDLTQASDLKDDSFDLSGGSTSLQVDFNVDFLQNGGGKLAGTGDTTVHLSVDSTPQPDFSATYVVKGAVTSVKGVGRLSLTRSAKGTAFLEGANRTVSVSDKMSAVIDPVSRQIVSGTFSRKASASGLGAESDSGAISPGPLPGSLGDGSWTLSIDLLPDSGNKYTGNTATVTLMTGMVYHFTVVGSYNASTQASKLVLKGVNEAQGSSLKVTMLGNEVTSILGKVSGQAISIR